MENQIVQIAGRIKGLREMLDMSIDEMARITGVSQDIYNQYEAGLLDFSFTFLMKCSEHFGVDIIELITGDMPRLSFYTVVRKGKGLPINRRQGFNYQHLAYLIKDKLAEPFLITAPYDENEQNKPITLSTHDGQEFNFVLEGKLKIELENHTEILGVGDSIFYDSSHGHGMISTGGSECKFLAIVIKK